MIDDLTHRLATMDELAALKTLTDAAISENQREFPSPEQIAAEAILRMRQDGRIRIRSPHVIVI